MGQCLKYHLICFAIEQFLVSFHFAVFISSNFKHHLKGSPACSLGEDLPVMKNCLGPPWLLFVSRIGLLIGYPVFGVDYICMKEPSDGRGDIIHGYEGDSLQTSFPPGLGKVTLLSQQMQNSSLALSNTSCPAKGVGSRKWSLWLSVQFSRAKFCWLCNTFGSDVKVGINTFTGGYESTYFHSSPSPCVLPTYTATFYPQWK